MDNRGKIESLILSCLFQDLSLIAEHDLKDSYFMYDKTKFFFSLVKSMSTKYKNIDEATVSYHVNSISLNDRYNEFGGWNSIRSLLSLGSMENYGSYVDDLEKINFIDNLKENGFNVNKDIEVDGITVNLSDMISDMTSNEIYDFYETLLNNSSLNSMNKDYEVEDLFYTDEEIYKIDNKIEDNTLSFATALTWTDDKGIERHINSFKTLDNLINGITHSNGVHVFAGHSGTGKTTFTVNVVMGLIESGAKVLIVSNEQQSKYFKEILLSIICQNVFRCYSINRKKISKGDLTEHERSIFLKANEFAKDKYTDNLKFVSMSEFKVEDICKIAKKLNLTEGYDTLVLDTFKPEDATGNNTVGEMSGNSRKLDTFGKQMKMRIILPAQCATYSEGKTSYMTSAVLSHSKQIKEVAHTILLLRKIIPEELDPTKEKYFLKPYKWERDESRNKPVKKYLEIIDSGTREGKSKEFDINCIDIQKHYILLFVDKNRAGKDQEIFLLEMDGSSGKVIERANVENIYKGQLTY